MTYSWESLVDNEINRQFASMVDLRRRLHMNPEPSGEEQNTSLHLYQKLGDNGFRVQMGPDGRGVIADLVDGKDPPATERIAIRADLDALRIHDAKQVEYKSQVDGIMHACGHDAHTAMVYGTLNALNNLAQSRSIAFPLRVRGIFQPSEETAAGAREMMRVGALEHVESILATHVDPSKKVGQVGLQSGVITANCDEVLIAVRGRGGHAARPHEATDAIVASAQLINAFYLLIPRAMDSQDAVVVTIGEIRGGDNANVIPEEVHLRGTVRTLDRGIREKTFDHIRHLASSIGQMTATEVAVDFGRGAPSVANDPTLTEIFRRAAFGVVSPGGILSIPRPSMGSEDFACYLEHASGALIRLGCVSRRAGGPPLHNPSFDIDEETLRYGARILTRAVLIWHEDKYTKSREQLS